MVAAGVNGTVATASITLPLYQLDAAGFGNPIGDATIDIPAFILAGTMTSTPLAQTYSTIVLNSRVRAVTTYSGLDFNSAAQFAGLTLMASTRGIVALLGDTDLGTEIAAEVLSGVTDFGDERLKRMQAAYIGYRGSNLTLTMIGENGREYTYAVAPRMVDRLGPSRVSMGKGLWYRYWQWKLANRSGGDVDLERLTMVVVPSEQRKG